MAQNHTPSLYHTYGAQDEANDNTAKKPAMTRNTEIHPELVLCGVGGARAVISRLMGGTVGWVGKKQRVISRHSQETKNINATATVKKANKALSTNVASMSNLL